MQNYVDDFMGLELQKKVWLAYETLGNLLRDVGVSEAEDKAVPPLQIVEFLRTGFDLIHQILFVTTEKLKQLLEELELWIHKS